MRLSFDPEALATLLTVALTYLIVYLLDMRMGERLRSRGLSVEGVVIMFRTRRLNDLINGLGARHPRLWRAIGTVAVATSIYIMWVGVDYLHRNLVSFVVGGGAALPVQPLIPGLTVGLGVLPYLALGFLLALVPHELMHGLVAAAEGVPVRGSGLFFLLFLFGGFIEPDEDLLNKARLATKLRIYAAGSFINFLTFLGLVALAVAVLNPQGVVVMGVMEGYPAGNVLAEGDVVTAFNGTPVRGSTDFTRMMGSTRPGDLVVLTVVREGRVMNVSLRLAPHPQGGDRGFMGVSFADYYPNVHLARALTWAQVITGSVAVINMLPILPFDGGQMALAVTSRLLRSERRARVLTLALSAYFAFILVLNIALSVIRWGVKGLPVP